MIANPPSSQNGRKKKLGDVLNSLSSLWFGRNLYLAVFSGTWEVQFESAFLLAKKNLKF
jgi:hypothetical protein